MQVVDYSVLILCAWNMMARPLMYLRLQKTA